MKRIIDISEAEYNTLKEKHDNGEGLGFFRNMILDSVPAPASYDILNRKQLAEKYMNYVGREKVLSDGDNYYDFLKNSEATEITREDALEKYNQLLGWKAQGDWCKVIEKMPPKDFSQQNENIAKPTDYVDCRELASKYADWFGYGYDESPLYKYLKTANILPRENVLAQFEKYGFKNTAILQEIDKSLADAVEEPPLREVTQIVRKIVETGYQRDCEVERERNGVVAIELSEHDMDAVADRVLTELDVVTPEDFYGVLATNGERVTDAVFHQIDQMKSEIEEFLEQENADFHEEMGLLGYEEPRSTDLSDVQKGDYIYVSKPTYDTMHVVKVDAIKYDSNLVNPKNTKGAIVYGIDLDCYNPKTGEYDKLDFFTKIDNASYGGKASLQDILLHIESGEKYTVSTDNFDYIFTKDECFQPEKDIEDSNMVSVTIWDKEGKFVGASGDMHLYDYTFIAKDLDREFVEGQDSRGINTEANWTNELIDDDFPHKKFEDWEAEKANMDTLEDRDDI